jgi:hypothetical protein
MFYVRRRDLITLLGGAASWPLAGRAQQGERMRRIGVLMALAADDPEGQARIKVFEQRRERVEMPSALALAPNHCVNRKLSAREPLDHPPLASLRTASWTGRGGWARSAPLRLR